MFTRLCIGRQEEKKKQKKEMDERTQISHAEFIDERPSSYHLTFLI